MTSSITTPPGWDGSPSQATQNEGSKERRAKDRTTELSLLQIRKNELVKKKAFRHKFVPPKLITFNSHKSIWLV